MKRVSGILLLALLCLGETLAHSGKPRYHVIIDTDGGMDDMRAISMLLSGNDIRVLAINCSQGNLYPEQVLVKVKALLKAYHHEGIPVGISDRLAHELPAWSRTALEFQWADEGAGPKSALHTNAMDLLNTTLDTYPDKVTLVALGSLRTYADWIGSNADAAGKTERIIWYNDHSPGDGFNYRVSPESLDFIKGCGLPLEIVSNSSGQLSVSEDYFRLIGASGSIYAKQIVQAHASPPLEGSQQHVHPPLWDDLVALYLAAPILFDIKKQEGVSLVSMHPGIPAEFVYSSIGELLASASVTNNRVFKAFPTDTFLYKPEYAGMVQQTLEKHGPIEWKAVSMTNEIHGHTGIYSIIGAKMGVRAMEYFNVGVNNLEVISFAGSSPPLSCFNDGIQISTGATIGQGLISISDSISAVPSALFTFNRRTVLLRVKPEIAAQMQGEIRYGVENFGLQTPTYWLYIEKLAQKYWGSYNRQEIFEIEIVM